jgi:hypothetical protein
MNILILLEMEIVTRKMFKRQRSVASRELLIVTLLFRLLITSQFQLPSMLLIGLSMVIIENNDFLGSGIFNNCNANLNHGVVLVGYGD